MFANLAFKEMKMRGWIALNDSEIDSVTSVREHGVRFQVSLSPYDIPEGVRGFYCPSRKKFIIEIKYISDEELVIRKLNERVDCLEGKNSGRLYGIEIDVENAEQVCVAVRSGLDTATDWTPDGGEIRRDINKKILSSVKNRVKDIVAC